MGALALASTAAACFLAGCASHPYSMSRARALMAQQDYTRALGEVDRVCQSEEDPLCLLEKGLLLHYAGSYRESNQTFERAEVLTDRLYTKSASREAASLVTSDLALRYVPRPFEQVLVNYFRALNYMFLADEEGALVECRKASQKLARYSAEDGRPYRQDAFLEYLTGVLYEWGGQTNDAYVSYKNALTAYHTYGELFGVTAPPELRCDLVRTARALGFQDQIDSLTALAAQACTDAAAIPTKDLAKVVVLVERGFVPAKQELALETPILKSEADRARGDPAGFSLGVSSRATGFIYDADDVAYFLRIALPHYPEAPPACAPSLYVDSLRHTPSLCEDVYAIARAELEGDLPGVFAKALARAIIKYKVTDKAGDKYGWMVRWLANLVTSTTEQADLRGWLSLPRSVYITTLYLEPGRHALSVQAADGGAPREVVLEARAGATSFVRFREY
ncbi:MAG: hypothetical protein WAW06_04340 [bacterium]